jgi:parallel beta-helix repeat protein
MDAFLKCRVWPAAAAVIGSGAVVAGMLLATPGTAQATTLACGSAVTTSVTLTANVNCTADTTDNGLNIEAPDVTVNLNGHSILGPGDTYQTSGVSDNGYSGVTVESGTISNFTSALDFEGSSGSDLTGIVAEHVTATETTLGDEDYGFYAEYLTGASISSMTVKGAYYGVYLADSSSSTVTGNQVSGAFIGLYDDGGMANTWSHNTVSLASYWFGVEALETTGTVIASNTITGSASDGVFNADGTSVSITGNTLSGLYDGIYDDESTGTTASGNTALGDLFGLYAYEPDGAAYTGNHLSHGMYGIETDYPASETLKKNTTDGNSEAGVYVYTADGTGTYSAALTSNTADKNAYGLYSQIPATGSGNEASGNSVLNCYNVKCNKAKGATKVPAPPHHPPVINKAATRAPAARSA